MSGFCDTCHGIDCVCSETYDLDDYKVDLDDYKLDLADYENSILLDQYDRDRHILCCEDEDDESRERLELELLEEERLARLSKLTRLTCEYRPEVHDPRFDELVEASDANAERRKRDADVDDWDNALKRDTDCKMCRYCEEPFLLNYETMENVEIYKNLAIGPVVCYACFQGYVDEHGTSKICLRN